MMKQCETFLSHLELLCLSESLRGFSNRLSNEAHSLYQWPVLIKNFCDLIHTVSQLRENHDASRLALKNKVIQLNIFFCNVINKLIYLIQVVSGEFFMMYSFFSHNPKLAALKVLRCGTGRSHIFHKLINLINVGTIVK